jgi:hypothetical protein
LKINKEFFEKCATSFFGLKFAQRVCLSILDFFREIKIKNCKIKIESEIRRISTKKFKQRKGKFTRIMENYEEKVRNENFHGNLRKICQQFFNFNFFDF